MLACAAISSRIDGEIAAKTPVMIEVADACLEVAAPRESQKAA